MLKKGCHRARLCVKLEYRNESPDHSRLNKISTAFHQNAPYSLFGSSWYCSECKPLSAASPSWVRSGRPTGVTAPVKNLGCHSLSEAFLSAAFCLCFSSISVFRFVARVYCLPTIALVTPSQNFKDSLGSCSSRGGTTLGMASNGLRSMIRILSCWALVLHSYANYCE
jgi:hypothetical protein